MEKLNQNFPFIMLKSDRAEIPLYRQIYKAVRRAILNGEFKPQAKLPASRTLAQQLGVSRITVINAYEQLYAEGYLEGKIGSGTFVAAELPDDVLQTKRVDKKSHSDQNLPVARFSSYGQRLATIQAHLTPRDEASDKPQPFASGLPAIDKFPFQIWARIVARIYSKPPSEMLGYSDPQGYAPLRTAIAAHLNSARGVNCQPEQVLITGGTQQSLDLVIRIFLSENDGVLIENPCYLNARGAFGAAGAKLIPVPVDDSGFDVTLLPPPSDKNIKLIYVTPSHHYPLGVTMSLTRRLALIEWAKKAKALIIEDDYDSEFRYSGHPLASLQGLDSAGRVIYLGTFSKTTFPALRLGCIIMPADLIEVFKLAHIFNRIQCPLIDQIILAEFIAEGHFERHVRQMRKLYDERRKYVLAQCQQHLSGLLEIQNADAGMHLIGWLPEKVSDQAISEAARLNNLTIAAISDHYIGNRSQSGLILGYTAFSEKHLESGVKKLRSLFQQNSEFRK